MKKVGYLFLTLCLTLCLCLPITVSAAPSLLVDSAGLLSQEQQASLLSALTAIQADLHFDVVVLTVDSIGEESPVDYADDYYDEHGYGYGDNHDGCLLLLAMESRDWWLSTTGYGIDVFTDAGIDYIAGEFLPYLSDGDYFEGFFTFAELCRAFIEQANTGTPYDREDLIEFFDYDGELSAEFYNEDGHQFKEPFHVVQSLGISLLIGVIVALIITLVWKSQLKPVKFETLAHQYLKWDTMQVTDKRDLFLYASVSKTRIDNDSNSGRGGGSSTHSSSSGTSHGGGGGKF